MQNWDSWLVLKASTLLVFIPSRLHFGVCAFAAGSVVLSPCGSPRCVTAVTYPWLFLVLFNRDVWHRCMSAWICCLIHCCSGYLFVFHSLSRLVEFDSQQCHQQVVWSISAAIYFIYHSTSTILQNAWLILECYWMHPLSVLILSSLPGVTGSCFLVFASVVLSPSGGVSSSSRTTHEAHKCHALSRPPLPP
jgi:hypothetical protein